MSTSAEITPFIYWAFVITARVRRGRCCACSTRLQPTVVLVELPADCESALSWVGHQHLVPPVALLGYVVDRPHRAAFLPFAEFSPEWQAFTWAARHGVPMRAIDLPLANSLADDADDGVGELRLVDHPVGDPLAALAAAAGDPDPERWWDDVIEHRGDGVPAFEAIAEAMSAVRGGPEAGSLREARREAHMRRALRRAQVDGFERIAVVCGAWHVPALTEPLPAAAIDVRTLRGLPKAKVGVSWVPWTNRRLATTTRVRRGCAQPRLVLARVPPPGRAGHQSLVRRRGSAAA